MSSTGKASSDQSGSSTFGQCTNPRLFFGSPSANVSGFGPSSSPAESSRAFNFASPAPGAAVCAASSPFGFGPASFGPSSSPAESSRASNFASPAPGAAFGASSSPFGTSIWSTPGFGTPSASCRNEPSAFGAPVAPSSSFSPFGTSIWSTPGFVTPATSFGNASSAFMASLTPSSSFLPCGTSIWSTPGFVAPAASFGNASSAFCSSLASSSSTFQTTASASGSSTFSFGASAMPTSDGSRIAQYTTTPEAGFDHGKIISICAMNIHSNKSHEELRADDYKFGDKGGPGRASLSRGSVGVAGTQQNHSSFPAATSNNSFNSHVSVFSNPFPPQPSMGTVSNEWSRSPWMICQNEKGHFFSQPSVATARVFPSVSDHRNPSTSNPFASQTKRVDNTYSGGTSSTEIDSFQNLFPSVIHNSSGRQTSQSKGSRLTVYTPTLDQERGKMQSISAMPMYKNMSHEELRSNDYRLGDKGGCKEFLTARTEACSLTHQNPFSPFTNQSLCSPHNSTCSTTLPPASQNFSWSSGFPSSSITSSGSLSCLSSTTTPGISTGTSSFLTSNGFQPFQYLPSSSPLTHSSFDSSGPFSPFSTSFSFVSSTSSPAISSGTTSFLTSTDSQPLQHFPSSSPSTTSPFVSSGPSFSPFSTSFSFVSSTSSPAVSSGTTSFLTSTDSQPLKISQLFAPLDRLTSPFIVSETTPTVPQNISSSATPTTVPPTISNTVIPTLDQQSVIANPCEALNMEQTSFRRPGTILSIQYGISSRPVTEHSSPARRTSLLRVKHFSIGRNRLQAEKCNAKNDGPKVAFFTEEERNCGTLKADSLIIPRNNPGCWISSPSKESVHQAGSQASCPPTKTNASSEDRMSGSAKDVAQDVKVANNIDGHNENVEALLPKLMAADYYTEPSISEIAAKEKTEPGFCSQVKDFVVGRVGYGSIKFLGETDIRRLELDSIIKFNERELLVYDNEGMEKPPVGQGLNKPAEATLLQVKCIGAKSGNQYNDGPRVEKCRERLIRKTEEHGAEFVSYNPVLGEWKFRVQHF